MKPPRGPGRPRNPVIGDPVKVDTWPLARWRVIAPKPTDTRGTFRMVRMDSAQGRGVELANIAGHRLRVVY